MKRLYKIFTALVASVSLLSVGKTTFNEPKQIVAASTNVDSYYSSVSTSTGESLARTLHDTISSGHISRGYDALFTAYKTTDCKPGTNEIWDMYSNCKFDVVKDHGATYKKEGDCYNREHTIPQSWFKKANPMVCDVHHIYPTDGKVNGIRSSFLHGEVDQTKTIKYKSTNGCMLGVSKSPLYSGTVFEVPDEYKGDFARTYFYMAIRYSDKVGSWGGEANKVFKGSYPYLTTYSIDTFTKWSEMDPVSQKEINRNNAAYNFQGNRNPFIDHPEYSAILWPSKYNQNVEVDQAKDDNVIAQIKTLPSTITLDNKTLVDSVNALYNALNYKEKGLVTNYSTLQAAVKKIEELSKGDNPTPTPNPNPNPGPAPVGQANKYDLSGFSANWEKNYDFTVSGVGFHANVAWANSQYLTGLRIGGNQSNANNIPSKFGSGIGGSIEMTTDVVNSNGVAFNKASNAQMGGTKDIDYKIYVSEDQGDTWTVIKSGKTTDTLSATLDHTAALARYALVITGTKSPRLDLGSIEVFASNEPVDVKVDLKKVRTNSYLHVSYKEVENEITEANVSYAIQTEISSLYNLDDVTYGVICVESSKLEGLIKDSYESGSASELAEKLGGTYKILARNQKDSQTFEINSKLNLDTTKSYVAVIVCEQDSKVIFANQTTLNLREMIGYYLDNNLIKDAKQVSVLEYLIK